AQALAQVRPIQIPAPVQKPIGQHGVIFGRVTKSGSPVAGAEVLMKPLGQQAEQRFDERSTRTGKDGAFRFENLPELLWYVQVSAPGALAQANLSSMTTPRMQGVELSLSPAATLHGVLVRNGRPVPNAYLELGGSRRVPRQTTTGPDGVWVFDSVPDQEDYVLRALTREGEVAEANVKVTAPKRFRVDLSLVPAGRGRAVVLELRTETGKVLRDAMPMIDGDRRAPDAQGRIGVLLPRGSTSVRLHGASSTGRVHETADVSGGPAVVRLAIPAGTIAVTGGSPLGFLVGKEPDGTQHSLELRDAEPSFRDLRAGKHFLAYRPPRTGSESLRYLTVDLPADGHVVVPVSSFKKGASWRGRVTDQSTGRPRTGVSLSTTCQALTAVEIETAPTSHDCKARSDAEGHFTFPNLQPGTHVVRMTSPYFVEHEVQIEVPEAGLEQDVVVWWRREDWVIPPGTVNWGVDLRWPGLTVIPESTGMRVDTVESGGAGDRAAVERGDLVVRVNGVSMAGADPAAFLQALGKRVEAELEIVRGGRTLEIKISARPDVAVTSNRYWRAK
ncbi:MAG: carboxypeptidase regulatory-like domain-containing protein, partial [Myxococcaceae bacterium]